MSYKFAYVLLSIFTLLSACNQTPPPEVGPIDYRTDPRILRGVWAGKNENGVSLKLNLKTNGPTEQEYFFTGTFKLGDASELPVTGQVVTSLTNVPLSPAQQADALPCDKDVTGAITNLLGNPVELRYDICGTIPAGSPPEFQMTLVDRNGPEPIISKFVLTKQPDEPVPNFLVKGTVTRLRGVPFTYDGEFIFTKSSRAVVQLWYSASYFGDAPRELVKEMIIKPITSLPISFKLEGDAEKTFERFGDYFLIVGVLSDDSGGTGKNLRFAAGDLINETYTPVLAAGVEVDVEVTGLEPCPPPGTNEGGLCAP